MDTEKLAKRLSALARVATAVLGCGWILFGVVKEPAILAVAIGCLLIWLATPRE